MPLTDRTARHISVAVLFLFIAVSVAGHVADGDVRVPPEYEPAPPSEEVDLGPVEPFCPDSEEYADWRDAQTVMGVDIAADPACKPDNPQVVAAVTKGTNNVPGMALMETGLHEDAVTKCCDKDGDGDPDVINITLEVGELNGRPTAEGEVHLPHEIAPGIDPGFWVFAPKTRGMAEDDAPATDLIRMPSPAIRVEEGDEVHVTLENTHYMPHTIHFHGTDHAYMVNGSGNDGVPQTSEKPVNPGQNHTYQFTPREPGTMFYHCHVQPSTHVLMGLQGMFVVEEERDNNTLQTFNIGNGRVRNPSQAVQEEYGREYDMQYTDVDPKMHNIINISNDPRVVSKMLNRGFDVTERSADYFLLNGKSFPYTMRESQVIVDEGEQVKLRVLNSGEESVSLHPHGHKPTITHYDGIAADTAARIQRDVFDISAAQRLDLSLNTTDDGVNSYGDGVWFMHDHRERATTTDGIGPGGDVTAITYESFLNEDGFPQLNGVSWEPYFTEEYYEREVPVWNTYTDPAFFGNITTLPPETEKLAAFGLIGLLLGALAGWWVVRG